MSTPDTTIDTSALIERLEKGNGLPVVCAEAAEALRTQTQRIQELEDECFKMSAGCAEADELRPVVKRFTAENEALTAILKEAKCGPLITMTYKCPYPLMVTRSSPSF